jgi:hypothetical protein
MFTVPKTLVNSANFSLALIKLWASFSESFSSIISSSIAGQIQYILSPFSIARFVD